MKILITVLTIAILNIKVFSQNFQWARSIGGKGEDKGLAVAIDANKNVYSIGIFSDTVDFDPGLGNCKLTANGKMDIFISKINAAGNFVWAKSIGGHLSEFATSIAIDVSGNIYLTGYYQDTVDFDPGKGIFNQISNGNNDIFILKLNPDGNFVWAKTIGGKDDDQGQSIIVDSRAKIFVAGFFSDIADFNTGKGTLNLTAPGFLKSDDAFILKLDSAGNFISAKNFGGESDDRIFSINIDNSGNIYTTGEFWGIADFDPDAGISNLTSAGAYDIFISKLDSLGNLIWAKIFGGIANDKSTSISVDNSGNICIVGYFLGTCDFDPGTNVLNLNLTGNYATFILKLNNSGNLVWAKSIDGITNNVIFAKDLAVDNDGNLYISGLFSGIVDFNPDSEIYNLKSLNYSSNIFILKLNSNGNFVWAISIGSGENDEGISIAIDNSRNVYTIGNFEQYSDFDNSSGYCVLSSNGKFDIFILKLNEGLSKVQNLFRQKDFSIFPNPSSSIFTIQSSSTPNIYPIPLPTKTAEKY